MKYNPITHEALIFEKIVDTAFVMIPELIRLAKAKTAFPSVNPLVDYMEKRKIKKEPTPQELLHNLINCELTEEHVLYTTTTPYSNVCIYELNDTTKEKPFGRFNVFVVEYTDLEAPEQKPLRYAVLCNWNLAVAVNVNFTRNTSESIATANYILCETIQVASELDAITDSSTVTAKR